MHLDERLVMQILLVVSSGLVLAGCWVVRPWGHGGKSGPEARKGPRR